jgi:hypothetical protein
MKKIFYTIVGLMFTLYGATQLYFIPYYNWQYAKENGFTKWLFLGEMVATGKAVIWPYFEFIAKSNQKKMSKQKMEQIIQVKASLLKELQEDFMLGEAMEMGNMNRSSAQLYLQGKGFRFVSSSQQEEATVDEYHIKDLPGQPSVIAVSLLSFGEQELVRLIVVMMHQRFEKKAKNYIKSALDTTTAGTKTLGHYAKLYFMGIHRVGPSKVIKISIREDSLKLQSIYSLYYAVSEE